MEIVLIEIYGNTLVHLTEQESKFALNYRALYCQAQPQLKPRLRLALSQLQLKLRLRLALFPADPTTRTPNHPGQ